MSSAVRNSNTYCPTHLLGIPKSVCWRLSNQMRLRSPHHFTNKGTYMLLLHKRELNHLWKALKISNVLKSWDLSDVSIPYKRAKNPKSYTVNWEDFPANPDGKHSLWLFCSCSDQCPEKRRLVWPHGVLICICALHQPLSSSSEPFSNYSFMWKAPLKEQQYWELNWCQSWGKPPGKLLRFKNQKNTTWVNFLVDVYLIRPKKSSQEIQACWKLGSLISQLAGWQGPCGRSSDKKDAALLTLNWDHLEKLKKERIFRKNQKHKIA